LFTSAVFKLTCDTNAYILFRFFGGGFGGEEEEDKTPKGDDVVVEIFASLEDLYIGNTMKVDLYFWL
jgi:DnaJ family protein B protein 11